MTSAGDILIAATDVDDRLLHCLADCRATFVRTFEEAQQVLRSRLFKMILIDLNFDNVRMFDLLHYVRSLPGFHGVPVLCVQACEAGAGLSAAFDRLVRMLGGRGFVDLRGNDELLASAIQRLCRIVGAEFGMDTPPRDRSAALCILIIDSDVDAAQRLGEVAEQAGHDVDFAYSGTAGLDAARRLRPDIVFVDLALASPEGYQLARRLRCEPGLRNARFVALTAAANEQDRERIREAGFDDQVLKPADPAAIRKLLDAPHAHMFG